MGLYRESDMSMDRVSIGYQRGIEGAPMGLRYGIDGVSPSEIPEVIDQTDTKTDKDTLKTIYKVIAEHSIAFPATRETLKIWTGKGDRGVRRGIEELRGMGIKIVALSDRYGYWLDSKGGGYDRMKAEMRSRAFNILKTLAKMDGELEGQFSWQDIQS